MKEKFQLICNLFHQKLLFFPPLLIPIHWSFVLTCWNYWTKGRKNTTFSRWSSDLLTPEVSGFAVCGREIWARFGYYEISQTRASYLEKMRTISLMVPNAWNPAEQGMKYLPSPFRWDGRALIKISYLHFHLSTSFPVCATFSNCSKNLCLQGMNFEGGSTLCLLNFA